VKQHSGLSSVDSVIQSLPISAAGRLPAVVLRRCGVSSVLSCLCWSLFACVPPPLTCL